MIRVLSPDSDTWLLSMMHYKHSLDSLILTFCLFEAGKNKLLHAFFDCMFSVVPVFFSQILVSVLYFSKYDLYVPFYFVLVTVYHI